MNSKQKTTKPKAPRKLSVVNPRHEAFANAVLEGHSESDAARAAGYNPVNASAVMRTETVQELLAKGREEVEDILTIKRLDVMEIFLEAIQMARTLADPANMINGADKIAKMMGYYAPETKRIELTTDQASLSAKLKGLTDAELFDIAASRATLVDGETIQ